MEMEFDHRQRGLSHYQNQENLFYVPENQEIKSSETVSGTNLGVPKSQENKKALDKDNLPLEDLPDSEEVLEASVSWAAFKSLNRTVENLQDLQKINRWPSLKGRGRHYPKSSHSQKTSHHQGHSPSKTVSPSGEYYVGINQSQDPKSTSSEARFNLEQWVKNVTARFKQILQYIENERLQRRRERIEEEAQEEQRIQKRQKIHNDKVSSKIKSPSPQDHPPTTP
jgi:hypothetical protein